MKKKLLSIALLSGLFSVSTAFADDMSINEDELFSDTSVMVDSTDIVRRADYFGVVESTTVGFSGQIFSSVDLKANRDFFSSHERDDVKPSALSSGNLMLDIRLPLGVKGFGNTEATWLPDYRKANFQLQELFVDVNISKWAYFRAGKQVLQWGRCYIWNPTDLINIEKKSLQKDLGTREGSYGIKMHLPFGSKWNIYGYVDLNNTDAVDSIAGTFKIESLIGNTEAGVGLWGKPGSDPVFGIDFSTSLLDFSIVGEVSLTSGKNYWIPDTNKFSEIPVDLKIPMKNIDEDVIARICFGISRTFDLLDVDDRLTVNAEYYYNQAGYETNIFKRYHIGDIIENVKKIDSDGRLSSVLNYTLSSIYEPNSHSRHYVGLTSSVSKFIISDMNLSFSGIVNANQKCGMLIAGVSYRNMYNYSLGMEISAFVGPEETEYTFTGNAVNFKVYTGIAF